MMLGLTMYGTAKRAVTYFTRSLAKESEVLTKGKVAVCRLAPGIMITDFITHANGDKTKINLNEKTKKIYNILGDYPETIVDYVVPRMIENTKNDKQILWLTNRRAFGRFLTAGFKKRDFFAGK
jgi:NAD(P)-dependent dehydrogenase (short-subunit alcohol dehydrogenase family)